MRIGVVGLGATGSHVARQLRVDRLERLAVSDIDQSRQQLVLDAIEGPGVSVGGPNGEDTDLVVLATPAGGHVAAAERAIRSGQHVVSLSDRLPEVDELLALHSFARESNRVLVVGAGFAPGLSCLLTRHAARLLDVVDSIAVASAGTAGPACARQHHRALKRPGRDWVDGVWIEQRGGTGRDLAWFPDPIGARDCYRAALASPVLMQRMFPAATRISARLAATRRDRFTSRLPMLRPPHADGGPGAIRVELRGRRDNAVETIVYGVMDNPSVAAGTVAAVAAIAVLEGRFSAGAYGLGEVDEPLDLLRVLSERGIRAATYEGSGPISTTLSEKMLKLPPDVADSNDERNF